MSQMSVSLPDVVYFQEGPGVRNTQFTTSGVKLLNGGNINNGVLTLDKTKIFISEAEAYGKYKHFLVDEGDLLIASSGITVDRFQGKITFAEKRHLPLCMNTSTIRFKSLDNKNLDIKYFSYFLQTRIFTDQLRRLITGSAQLNFGPSHLKQIKVPMADLADQKRIAEILGKADALRKKGQQMLKHYDDLAQSLFIDMFGDPVRNEKEWEKRPLKYIVSFSKGLIDPRDSKYSNMYHVGGDNIVSNTGELINLRPAKSLNLISGKFLFDNSYILYNKIRPYLNKVAKPEFSGICSADMYPIKPSLRYLNRDYLWSILTTKDFLKFTDGIPRRANIPKINKEELGEYLVMLPPIELQKEFTRQVQNIEQQKRKLRKQIQESENLFQALLQQAFNGGLN